MILLTQELTKIQSTCFTKLKLSKNNCHCDVKYVGCIVAKQTWAVVSEFFALDIGSSYESIARFWVSNKKHSALNSICAAVLRNIWKIRNDLTFNGVCWLDTKQVLRRIFHSIQSWKIIFKDQPLLQIEGFCQAISKRLREPLQLDCG